MVDAFSTPERQRARILLFPALNAMSALTATRTMALQTHPPTRIFAMRDLEHPRLGLIWIERADQVLADHRKTMD